MTVTLACAARPPSRNNRSGKGLAEFTSALSRAYTDSDTPMLDGLLSGTVCWFVRDYRPERESDADNISKAVWDILGSLGLYDDDKQIRLRISGVFDLSPDSGGPAFEDFDFDGLPPEVIAKMAEFAGGKGSRHFTVIRVSSLALTLLNACFR